MICEGSAFFQRAKSSGAFFSDCPSSSLVLLKRSSIFLPDNFIKVDSVTTHHVRDFTVTTSGGATYSVPLSGAVDGGLEWELEAALGFSTSWNPANDGDWTVITWADAAGTIAQEPGFNLGGIVVSPDRDALVVAQGNVGALWRFDLRTAQATTVDIGSTDLTNADGLVLLGLAG